MSPLATRLTTNHRRDSIVARVACLPRRVSPSPAMNAAVFAPTLLEKWTLRPWRNMHGVCTISIDCRVVARFPLAGANCISMEAVFPSGGPTVEYPVNRREFISRGSLLPAGALLGVGLGGGCPYAKAATPIKRFGGPKLKTSLNAYSFNKSLNDQLKGREQECPCWSCSNSVPS